MEPVPEEAAKISVAASDLTDLVEYVNGAYCNGQLVLLFLLSSKSVSFWNTAHASSPGVNNLHAASTWSARMNNGASFFHHVPEQRFKASGDRTENASW